METSEREDDVWFSESSSTVTLAVEWRVVPHEIRITFPVPVGVLMDTYQVFQRF